MADDDTIPPGAPVLPKRLPVPEAAPVALAEAEAAPEAPPVPAPSCETCQGTRAAGDGSPCPGCISLVPPALVPASAPRAPAPAVRTWAEIFAGFDAMAAEQAGREQRRDADLDACCAQAREHHRSFLAEMDARRAVPAPRIAA